MSSAMIPLAAGTSGTLTVTYRISSGASAMFPPLVRFLPANLDIMENTAFANRTALPVGAAAFALLLILGVFLLGISMKRIDWSLIPLIAAVAGLIVFRVCQDEGYYFLPEQMANLLGRPELGIVTVGAFVLYFLMNRQRRFWKYIGICAAWSAAVLLICYLASLACGGYLARYINTSLISELMNGYINSLVYWLSFWLAFVTALISAYSVARTYASQEVQMQGLQLKNQMITESCRLLENSVEQRAALWHEIRHQLTALDCLYQKQDYDGIGRLLTELLGKQEFQTETIFCANRIINLILQDAAARAKKQDIRFQAQVSVPKDLNIPEIDLCSLLLNMLDNALENAQKVTPPDQRTISIQIRMVNLYLAIKCENTFNGEIQRDKKGNLLTTKKDAALHGFGCQQMIEIARKYHSTIRFDTVDQHTFRAETALRIPD